MKNSSTSLPREKNQAMSHIPYFDTIFGELILKRKSASFNCVHNTHLKILIVVFENNFRFQTLVTLNVSFEKGQKTNLSGRCTRSLPTLHVYFDRLFDKLKLFKYDICFPYVILPDKYNEIKINTVELIFNEIFYFSRCS